MEDICYNLQTMVTVAQQRKILSEVKNKPYFKKDNFVKICK